MKKIELLHFTVAKNCVSTTRHCRAVFIFYLTAQIRLNLIRAVKIFLSSSWHFEKKCQAVEIRADGFWAVHPDSLKGPNRKVALTWSNSISVLISSLKWVLIRQDGLIWQVQSNLCLNTISEQRPPVYNGHIEPQFFKTGCNFIVISCK
jgi:hypothetical protein